MICQKDDVLDYLHILIVWGQSGFTMGRVIALHAAHLSLITLTPYGPQAQL